MSTSLPDIGHVTTSHVDGLDIRLARGGRSDGVPILLTAPNRSERTWDRLVLKGVSRSRRHLGREPSLALPWGEEFQ